MSDQEKQIRDDQADVVSGGVIPIDPPVHPPSNPVPPRFHDPIPRKTNPTQ
ncbi:MAG TPA: hypothetical protein VKR56_11680 [Candidatus Cybelea sp.]|nr:hypothetical protein [Candidatus Cybelea sp.]